MGKRWIIEIDCSDLDSEEMDEIYNVLDDNSIPYLEKEI
jgi:hypothetical protein